MVKPSHITALLKALQFTIDDGAVEAWTKAYPNHSNYRIKVDIEAESIDYGKKITVQDKTTCNFKAEENLVVLECVNRLLEKGYKPENLILEKKWPTGHGTSGKLDILITRGNGNAHLMIECKTSGVEFDTAFKRLQKDGGQLFTYFQQDKNAEILMLYASNCNSRGKLQYQNEIIKIEDDYRQTSNVTDFYDRWNKLTKNNGVFDEWVKPYDFESKALRPNTLEDITQKDSSFIFNQFLEILRHNVVSDKPNAFNKIFTLFLCKIYDEKATKPNEELAFQWFYTNYTYNGISYPPDDNISFQKRLTDLYKKGMKEFLDKDVTDISDAEFEKKYGTLNKNIRAQLLEELVEIRLKKNNEFAFKEVYDDESFEDNAKVVKEIVELLQGYKIRYTKKQQYLSDFFEMLLTTGLKQEAGQFFTPVPVAQFIIKSLPLDIMVREKLEKGEKGNYLPTIIDYAAGSGHFITESMHEIQSLINGINPDDYISDTAKKIKAWKTDHFDWAYDYVYGIEKDYRLVKVGKVGCYLHGDGLAQIIHSDGLADFDNTPDYKGLLKKTSKDNPQENKQFDIVISNPPYSVSAFKNNASKYYGDKDFELYNSLTDQSSEIECLFIERTKQLLKEGGLAGIILPSSILSNTGIYTKAREIILKYFEIVGIAELGSNTFMATGTNTVTLFLRRRDNYAYNNTLVSVQKSFEHLKDVTILHTHTPLQKYVEHVWDGISLDDYWTLLKKSPNKAVQDHEIFRDYKKKIKAKDDEALFDILLAREIEKTSYFILAYGQQVVVAKSGEKNEEKEFLGYEFSNRRGSEGIHPIQRGKTIDECTKLFDSAMFDNPEKASTYFYKAFNGDFKTKIDDSLKNNISRHNLIDMLAFDREAFDKTISLAAKKKVIIKSSWPLRKLGELINLEYGKGLTEKSRVNGPYPVMGSNGVVGLHNEFLIKGPSIIVGRKGSVGKVKIIEENSFPIDTTFYVHIKTQDIGFRYCAIVLKHIEQDLIDLNSGMGPGGLNRNEVYEIKIPLPPVDLQEKIVLEIGEIEKEEQTLNEKLKVLQDSISKYLEPFQKQSYNAVSIQNSLEEIKGFKTKIAEYEIKSKGQYPVITQGKEAFISGYSDHAEPITDTPIIVFGDHSCTFKYVDFNFLRGADGTVLLKPIKELEPKFFYYYLSKIIYGQIENKEKYERHYKYLKNNKIPLPSYKEQKQIVSYIENIEAQIAELQEKLAKMPAVKDAVLKKYF